MLNIVSCFHLTVKGKRPFVVLFFLFLSITAYSNVTSDLIKMSGSSDTLKSKDILFTYPTPDELMDVINEEGLKFNDYYLNSPKNIVSYIDTKTKYLNMGVYLSDLAYSSFFLKRNKILNYIEVIGKQSEDLLIPYEVRLKMKNDLSNNIENLDSIYHLTNLYYHEIMKYLDYNDNNNLMILITTGTYIESIYLTLSLVKDFSSDKKIVKNIIEQKNALITLYNTSKLYENSYYVKDVMRYQKQIIDFYMKLESVDKGKIIFIKDPNGTIKFKSDEKIIITEKQFEALKELVTKVRNEITLN